MKILYSVQATGNGHISRAMELLPYLQQYGTVDIFLSGNNSSLQLDAPIKYRSKGLSLYYTCTGGLSYWKTFKKLEPLRLKKEINELPVDKYDLVLNDFEFITSAACAKKNIPSVNFGHQASFLSPKTPRPFKKNVVGEWLLRNYGKATTYVGLHFEKYDDFIFTPVIKQNILDAEPADKNYITVYLPSFCEPQLLKTFNSFKDHQFEIFCSQTKMIKQFGHIKLLPVNRSCFTKSLINCTGIITGGGFETPAEALHLNKKIMSIPINGQYEQQCNAVAAEKLGAYILHKIDDRFKTHFYNWINKSTPSKLDYSNSIPEALSYLIEITEKRSSPVSALQLSNAFESDDIPHFTF
jgi:uncharacterized protein (TIGR00661 family)